MCEASALAVRMHIGPAIASIKPRAELLASLREACFIWAGADRTGGIDQRVEHCQMVFQRKLPSCHLSFERKSRGRGGRSAEATELCLLNTYTHARDRNSENPVIPNGGRDKRCKLTDSDGARQERAAPRLFYVVSGVFIIFCIVIAPNKHFRVVNEFMKEFIRLGPPW